MGIPFICLTCAKDLDNEDAKYCSPECRRKGEEWLANYERPLREILERSG